MHEKYYKPKKPKNPGQGTWVRLSQEERTILRRNAIRNGGSLCSELRAGALMRVESIRDEENRVASIMTKPDVLTAQKAKKKACAKAKVKAKAEEEAQEAWVTREAFAKVWAADTEAKTVTAWEEALAKEAKAKKATRETLMAWKKKEKTKEKADVK